MREVLPALGLLLLASAPSPVFAQSGEIEEVVVTGSYIKGTPEDAELPVDVINRSDLEDIGTPTVLELVRNLGVTSGNLAETNQFAGAGQANEGMATINLRGLGSARTLVLFNGRRHVSSEAQGVDINALPVSAIGRLEILKDGAAALYGSDAIGGVVNFITREGFEGLEIGGSYQDIKDAGDWDVNGIFGIAGDNWNWSFAAEYAERQELQIRDRDWALRPFSENSSPGGWSSIANPANIIFPGYDRDPALAGSQNQWSDPECQNMGAYRDSANLFSTAPAVIGQTGSCGFQYTFFDNLIEKTESIKLFSEANVDLNENTRFHVEGLYSEVKLPEWNTSPSYPPQSIAGPDRRVYADHPGLVDMLATYPELPQTLPVGFVIPINRAFGVSGFDGEAEAALRRTRQYRLAVGLDGTLFDQQLNYDVSVAYSLRERRIEGQDMYIERMGYALRGFGGPNCDRSGGLASLTPGGNGCEYYNPFSNALPSSVVNGYVNPNYNPAVANSAGMRDWLIAQTGSDADNELLVFQAVFSGETGLELGGGNVGWAAGAQSRRERYDFDVEDIANRSLNPCPWTENLAIELGYTASLGCDVESGRLAFLAATVEEYTSRTVYGIFGELALPITDTFNMQAAVRYEDYGGKVGSTIDPKLAFSWNLTDELSLRGSASTTFRGPPQSYLGGTGTALQFITPASAFKAVDINGNEDLKPESAVATNLGVIYQNENFYGSIDWWRFDFDDPFQTESAGQLVSAYSTNQCQDGGAGAATAYCQAIRTHIYPLGISTAGLQRVDTNIINGTNITTSGIDVFAQYDFDDVFGGVFSLGAEGTYVLEYKSKDFLEINGAKMADGGDFAGFYNVGLNPFTPIPELKGNVFAKFSRGNHRISVLARYVDKYEDANNPSPSSLAKIDDHVTFDAHYNVALFERALLSLSVINIADEDPPSMAGDLNYDVFTQNAFGRMIKLGFKYTLDM